MSAKIAAIVVRQDGESLGNDTFLGLVQAASKMFQETEAYACLPTGWVSTRFTHETFSGFSGVVFDAEITVGRGLTRLTFIVIEEALKVSVHREDVIFSPTLVIPDGRHTRRTTRSASESAG